MPQVWVRIHLVAIAGGLHPLRSDFHQCELQSGVVDQNVEKGADVSVVLSMLKAVSHATDHAILRLPGPEALSKSVMGAVISGKDGMKVRKKFAIPKNERTCFHCLGRWPFHNGRHLGLSG